MAALNLCPEEDDDVIKRMKATLKALKATRLDIPNPFTFFSGYSEARFRFAGYRIKIDNDNWTGITLYGDDEAIDAFMAVYDTL